MPRQFILTACAKAADKLRKLRGIVCVQLPTGRRQLAAIVQTLWVNTLPFTQFVYKLCTGESTAKFAVSSLLITEISPLSTMPITDTTFYKRGEI